MRPGFIRPVLLDYVINRLVNQCLKLPPLASGDFLELLQRLSAHLSGPFNTSW
jgi:hypothetical protein